MHTRRATAATPMLPVGAPLVFPTNRVYRTEPSDQCCGHLKTWSDGRRVLRAIVRERLRAPARAETRPARPAAAPGTVRKP